MVSALLLASRCLNYHVMMEPTVRPVATVPWDKWATFQGTQNEGGAVEAVPPECRSYMSVWFAETLKTRLKSTESGSALHYLHGLGILNNISDKVCFPEKKKSVPIYTWYRIIAEVTVDFMYKNILVTFKLACLDYASFNKHSILHGSEHRESTFPAGPHHANWTAHVPFRSLWLGFWNWSLMPPWQRLCSCPMVRSIPVIKQ